MDGFKPENIVQLVRALAAQDRWEPRQLATICQQQAKKS